MYTRVLNWVGGVLALAGGFFVLFRLHEYSLQLDLSRFDNMMWSALVGLSLIYGGGNIMLALAWRNLLMYFSSDISRLQAVKIYGLTQLAKYVPGNIMHLVSRQAMGVSSGLPGRALVKASVWEITLISITGSVFVVFLLPQFFSAITYLMLLAGFVSIIFFTVIGLKKFLGISITLAFACYIVFYIISALIFVSLIVLLKGEEITPLAGLIFVGAFIVACLAGRLTPGAPAGLGVREFVLIVLLKDLIPESDLLLAVLLSRTVTVCGDICFFLLASYVWHKNKGSVGV